ncbi:MAG: hypothetical protein H7222_18665 [Methylotenera sp.]|nr:hypothetical protein [Oligoflexia bacterium]
MNFSGLSIIIPVAPRDESWRSPLQDLDFLLKASVHERPEGVKWVTSPIGRARQLNSGAAVAERKNQKQGWLKTTGRHLNLTAKQSFTGALKLLRPGLSRNSE